MKYNKQIKIYYIEIQLNNIFFIQIKQLIVTSAEVLNIQPSDLPAIGMATDIPTISKHEVKLIV